MNKIINLVVAVLCIVNIVYHFINTPEKQHIFGFEVHNMVYLAFWAIILFSCVNSYLKASKTPKA